MKKKKIKPYQDSKRLANPLAILLITVVTILGIIYISTLYSFHKQYNEASRACGHKPVIVVDYEEHFSLIGAPSSWSKVFAPINPDYNRALSAVKNPFSRTKTTISKYFCNISDFEKQVWLDDDGRLNSKIINYGSNYTPQEQERFIKYFLTKRPDYKYYEPSYIPPGTVIKSKTIDPTRGRVDYEIGPENSSSKGTLHIVLNHMYNSQFNTDYSHGAVALPPNISYDVLDSLAVGSPFSLSETDYKKLFNSLVTVSNEKLINYKLDVIN